MEFLAQLWLPIVASAAAVFVASALAWTALPHHRKDWSGLPDENRFIETLRSLSIPAGNYGFPHCAEHKQMKDPEFQRKWKEGPAGMLSVWPRVSMGGNMVKSFLVYLVVSVFIAYLGWTALGLRQGFTEVFQVLGTAGVLGYAFAHIPGGIWFNHYPRAILMNTIDGVVFGLITGAIFAGLWPAA